nr:MAG TPA: hypothetical protein [Caudoviricetes sp.]
MEKPWRVNSSPGLFFRVTNFVTFALQSLLHFLNCNIFLLHCYIYVTQIVTGVTPVFMRVLSVLLHCYIYF